MKRKLALVLSMVVMGAALFTGCGSKSVGADGKTANEKAEGETFKVGLECGYAPFNWTQSDASNGAVPIEGSSEYAGGYDVQIAKKMFDNAGVEYVAFNPNEEFSKEEVQGAAKEIQKILKRFS